MRWAVEGCIKWRSDGILDPSCVKEATREYKAEMDLLAGFIDQCVVIDYECKDKIMASDLFKVYIRWAKENNEYEMSSKKFFMEMAKKLPEKGRNGTGVFYRYIKLSDYAVSLGNQGGRQYKISDFTKG